MEKRFNRVHWIAVLKPSKEVLVANGTQILEMECHLDERVEFTGVSSPH